MGVRMGRKIADAGLALIDRSDTPNSSLIWGHIMTSGWLKLGSALLLAATPVAASADEHFEYYVTGHNHYGETVYFSCNGGTPREIHNGGSRTVNFHGGETVHARCVATHDGKVVWSQSSHMSHHQPKASFDITPPDSHEDDKQH